MENEQASQARFLEKSTDLVDLEPLILASSSPRRAEILKAVDWPFEVQPTETDESMQADESATAYVQRLAQAKAMSIAAERPSALVLGADTVVVIDDEVLGKPRDARDARRMLQRLQNRRHEVLTGVALVRQSTGQRRIAYERTVVKFREMSDSEIDWYVATGEPLDKAGAYGVQGCAALFIEGVEGDYWNVVGLPVQLVYRIAREFLQT